MSTNITDRWDPALYDSRHGFVHQLGSGILELLAPRPGERILDVGCGTGHLTQKIADAGATVVGIDSSPAMVAEARRNFPSISFDVASAIEMTFAQPFDAVFSNAALHWVKPPERAVERMHAALKPGGRLVVEFGGHGNVSGVLSAAVEAGASLGFDVAPFAHINYFPRVGEYAGLLEKAGFEVGFAQLFDRPTRLEGSHGLRDWLRMFRPGVLDALPGEKLDDFFSKVESLTAGKLLHDGVWYADYRRLRVIAVKSI